MPRSRHERRRRRGSTLVFRSKAMTRPNGSTDPMRLRRFADIFRHESVAVSCHTHKHGREPAPLCDARSLANRSCRSDLSFRTGGVQIPRAPARISSGPSPKAAFSLGHPSLTAPGRTTHGVHHAIWFSYRSSILSHPPGGVKYRAAFFRRAAFPDERGKS